MAEAPRARSGSRLVVFRDFYRLMGRSGRWWLMPLVMFLTTLGLVFAGLQAVQYVAPFIYAVF